MVSAPVFVLIFSNDLEDWTEKLNVKFMRAPNRYRKLLKDTSKPPEERDEFGLDFTFEERNGECIAMQKADFESPSGLSPSGFQANIDNDIYITWEKQI